ncbi:hypothetical protein [Jiella marina]|uniref:hypothetical protein n=1 Tax=Jiella sp. LLJ827 TaxID=2917712 RepID=UPI002100E90C|nr:hypothetical protein [Jiella sp. LLJ827]MCQ0987551.1 hypothetical protein [Jiella sp. LLJ827]
MTEVFRKFIKGEVVGDGSTVAVNLHDNLGFERTIFFTTESLTVLAHELLALQARADRVQSGSTTRYYDLGSKIAMKAIPTFSYQLTITDDPNIGGMIIWSETGAPYSFQLTRDLARELDRSLAKWLAETDHT